MGGSQGMLHLFGALLFWWGSKQVVEGHVVSHPMLDHI